MSKTVTLFPSRKKSQKIRIKAKVGAGEKTRDHKQPTTSKACRRQRLPNHVTTIIHGLGRLTPAEKVRKVEEQNKGTFGERFAAERATEKETR